MFLTWCLNIDREKRQWHRYMCNTWERKRERESMYISPRIHLHWIRNVSFQEYLSIYTKKKHLNSYFSILKICWFANFENVKFFATLSKWKKKRKKATATRSFCGVFLNKHTWGHLVFFIMKKLVTITVDVVHFMSLGVTAMQLMSECHCRTILGLSPSRYR